MNWSRLVDWRRWRKSAVLAGTLGTGIRVGANIALLPLVLVKLSVSEFAVWSVFVALGNFGNLADLGFGSTIPRVYSYLLAGAEDFEAEGIKQAKGDGQPNFAGIRRVNATVRSLYLRISLGAMALLAIGGSLVLIKPAAQTGFPHLVWGLWCVYVVAIGYNLTTSHWVLAVQGLNRMRDLQMVYVMGGLSYALCAAILLLCKLGLASMVAAMFLKGFVMHRRCRQIYEQIVPDARTPVEPEGQIIKKLWPNAYKFGIISIGAYLLSNGNVLVCSQFLGKEITASFGLTTQIANFLMSFATLWLVVKWPQISILRTQGRLEEMATLFARRLTLVMVSFVGLGAVALLAGNRLLAWKGTHTRLLPMPYLTFYIVYLTQQVFYVQFGTLAFTENVVPFFKIAIFTGITACVLSVALTPLFGLWGLLLAPWIAESIYSSWFTVRRGFQGQPLSPRQFVLAAIGGHA